MELQEFSDLYAQLNAGAKWKIITCPVMTRWYTVGFTFSRTRPEIACRVYHGLPQNVVEPAFFMVAVCRRFN